MRIKRVRKVELTFFFCTCSFSEALEGFRLSIFSSPSVVPSLNVDETLRERLTGSYQSGSICRSAVTVVGLMHAERKVKLHRSEAGRKSRGHTETEEANPVFGAGLTHILLGWL